MFRYILLLLASLSLCPLHAQEICDNGLDDDADGLVDLNDTVDCACTWVPDNVGAELLQNSSFEASICCPQSYSQMYCTEAWEQATDATSDLYHMCGFMPPVVPMPLPDGEGIVAGLFTFGWLEYTGTNLVQPLLADQEYSFTFKVASTAVNGTATADAPIYYGQVDITVFGYPTSAVFPLSTTECPEPEGWTELGHVTYDPDTVWTSTSIALHPATDIGAIIFGPPCTLPEDYDDDPSFMPYFMFDGLSLRGAEHGTQWIGSSGSFCMDGVTLIGHAPSGSSQYQWFQNGIALPGAVDSVLLVTDAGTGSGDYQFVAYGDSGCAVAMITVPEPVYPDPVIIDVGGTLYCDEPGTAYQWFLGEEAIPGATGPSFTPLENGTYHVQVTGETGCVGTSEPYALINTSVAAGGASPLVCAFDAMSGLLRVDGADAPVRIDLYDAAGRCLKTGQVNSGRWSMDLSSLPKGLYTAVLGTRAWRLLR